MTKDSKLAQLPSVDKLLGEDACQALILRFGRQATTDAIRAVLGTIREQIKATDAAIPENPQILSRVNQVIETDNKSSLVTVLNLTGTVLHTNLGRASLPDEAIHAMNKVASGASNLEYDLETGDRGDRDTHIEALITRITGAEAATVVNNNAAAILLTLNTLAMDREVPVSRGELVEIGGSFRIPEIMQRAGCRLIEIGTTNRTHLRDYRRAVNSNTALLMKVHTSNYAIQGFTQSVSDADVATLAHELDLPFVTDLGSGTLVDLTRFGLPWEPTVTGTLTAGADIVTFSGDKLLGGPQAGIIVGRKTCVDAIKANPMKRALRVDKITMAALAGVLRLYLDPDSLRERLPTLRLLSRSKDDISKTADEVLPAIKAALGDYAAVSIEDTNSQIGSGSLPLDLLPSIAIVMEPVSGEGKDARLQQIAAAFRRLDTPVIGRIHDGKLLFDLRTLERPSDLIKQLPQLKIE